MRLKPTLDKDRAVALVVEDDSLIRMNAAAIMEDVGFAVIEACDADEAMRALENQHDIRAVFTDITMPGSMDGWALAQTICSRWPLIHLIITSGRTMPSYPNLPKSGRFIAKPYAAAHVRAALTELAGGDLRHH